MTYPVKHVTQSLTITVNVAAMILIGAAAALQFGTDMQVLPPEWTAVVATLIAILNNVVNIMLRFRTDRPVSFDKGS